MPLNESVNNSQSDADFVPRCTHELMSGETCGQPALRGQQVCRFHREVQPRPEFVLPAIEDAASLQLALNRVMRALADDLIAPKKASLLMYGLQIASTNLKRLRDERKEQRERTPDDEPSLLRLLLEKLQIEETPEELFAKFAEEDGQERWWEEDTRAANPRMREEQSNAALEGERAPTSDHGERASACDQDERAATCDNGESAPASVHHSASFPGDQKPEAPANSTRVNIKACADPRYRKPINANRKPITANRRRKITSPGSQTNNASARGPAGWTM